MTPTAEAPPLLAASDGAEPLLEEVALHAEPASPGGNLQKEEASISRCDLPAVLQGNLGDVEAGKEQEEEEEQATAGAWAWGLEPTGNASRERQKVESPMDRKRGLQPGKGGDDKGETGVRSKKLWSGAKQAVCQVIAPPALQHYAVH